MPKEPRSEESKEIPSLILTLIFISIIVGFFLINFHPETLTTLPALENQFCSIVNAASATYQTLSQQQDKAHEQRNGIVEDQLRRQMTAVSRSRNADVFRVVQQANFHFDDWTMTVMRIDSPEHNTRGYVANSIYFEVHPVCSTITKIRAWTEATQQTIDLFAQKRQGDKIMVSGDFLESFGGPETATSPPSADEFEGSFTEFGSMDEPEYSVFVSAVGDE